MAFLFTCSNFFKSLETLAKFLVMSAMSAPLYMYASSITDGRDRSFSSAWFFFLISAFIFIMRSSTWALQCWIVFSASCALAVRFSCDAFSAVRFASTFTMCWVTSCKRVLACSCCASTRLRALSFSSTRSAWSCRDSRRISVCSSCKRLRRKSFRCCSSASSCRCSRWHSSSQASKRDSASLRSAVSCCILTSSSGERSPSVEVLVSALNASMEA
mmetsp:Transcript_75644/g.131044  ORF Transcript_75644/g.131044 Transcript_75644/m.131044 type:complete len:216 (+) Transcript_75644:893-1540(+)